jgi:hypothetical protein
LNFHHAPTLYNSANTVYWWCFHSVDKQSCQLFKSGNGLILLCCLVGFIALSVLGDGKKGKLSKGRFGKEREKGVARQQSIKQIRSPQPNSVSLYIGRPSNSPFEKQPLYLPDAQRGIAVCGGPGSGKTFSVIDPAIRSAIDQGFPAIVYDLSIRHRLNG